jgi:hypothetical protein
MVFLALLVSGVVLVGVPNYLGARLSFRMYATLIRSKVSESRFFGIRVVPYGPSPLLGSLSGDD